jgi:Protein of unknown function (DUF3071)
VSDLRLIGRSDDGSELELQSKEGATFTLRISDQLRALVNQPRLVSVLSEEEESTVTVKDVQARLRSGESIDSIVRTTGWSAEKVEKFSGPILQERAYVIGLALAAQLRKEKHAPTLTAATISQLAPRGVDMTLVEWNTWRLPDGTWNIILFYPTKNGGTSEANWSFDLGNRSLEALDDDAAWIAGDELETQSAIPSHGIVYPASTPAPRLVAVREVGDHMEYPEPIKISSLDAIINSGPSQTDSVTDAEKRDGITKRLKIPSWDDIMFGGPKETSEEE